MKARLPRKPVNKTERNFGTTPVWAPRYRVHKAGNTYGGVVEGLHAYLTSALEGSRWSASRSGPCNREERPQKTHWTEGQVGDFFGKRKYRLSTSGIDPRFLGCPADSLFTISTNYQRTYRSTVHAQPWLNQAHTWRLIFLGPQLISPFWRSNSAWPLHFCDIHAHKGADRSDKKTRKKT
jgi:hypothetical protein